MIQKTPATLNARSERKPIRQRSRRMSKLMAHYRRLRDVFLMRNQFCVVYYQEDATQVHHVRGRAGTLLLDTRFWKPVCMSAHEWIRDCPNDARADGFLCQRGEWNVAPDDAETRRLKDLIRELAK